MRETIPAALAVTTLGIGIAGCGDTHKNGSPTLTNAAQANLDPKISADCAQTPLDLSQYEATNGDRILQPLNAKLVNGEYTFASGDTAVTSQEIASKVGRNTAAIAIIYTIIEAAKTNIVPADAVNEATSTLELIQSDAAKRSQLCNVVISGILKAPEQFNYQSSTGKVLTFKPVYDGSKTLVGLNGDVTSNTGPTPVFNIAPVAGSQNEALQKAIASEWGITSQSDIIETAHDNGNVRVSHTGKNVKVSTNGKFQALTTHNNQPQPNQNQNQNQNQNNAQNNGGGTSTGTSRGVRPGKKHHEIQTGPAAGKHKGQSRSQGPTQVSPGREQTPSGGGGGGNVAPAPAPAPAPTPTTPETTPTPPPTTTTPPPTTPTPPPPPPPVVKPPSPGQPGA